MKYGEQFNPFGLFRGLFVPNCIAQSDLSDSAKLLMGRLFQYAGKDGNAFPTRNSLAKELNWKLSKLDRMIRYLKDYKLIKTFQEDEHSPSTYIFLYHPIYESTTKNNSRGTTKNNSRGTTKNDNHKEFNKEKENKKDISKDISNTSSEVSSCPNQEGEQEPLIKNKKFENFENFEKFKKRKKEKNLSRKIKNSCGFSARLKKLDNSNNSKPPKAKYKHTVSDFRNYNELKSHGITKHKPGTKSEINSLDKLHALFDPRCKPPYYPVHIPESFIDYKWTIDDLIEIFTFHLENAPKFNMKPVRSIGKFIFSEGFNGRKSWSPLLFWAQKMLKLDGSLTKEGEILFKIMKHKDIRDVETIDSYILNKVAKELKEKEEVYFFVDTTSQHINYPAGIISAFVNYVKERANNMSFKLVYINKKGFVDEFLDDAVKRNTLRKSSGRFNINLG